MSQPAPVPGPFTAWHQPSQHQQSLPFAPAGMTVEHLNQQPAPAASTPGPMWAQPTYAPPGPASTGPSGARIVALIACSFVVTFGALLLAVVVVLESGPMGFLLGLLCALVPMSVVVACLVWLDRWEPEGPLTLALAFAYGAVGAALISMLVNTSSAVVLYVAGGESFSDFATSSFVAPAVEETVKGLGLLVFILVLARKHYTGLIDCVVIAGLIACGFAFTENILYFGRAYAEGNSQAPGGGAALLTGTFIMRGIVSPFAHPLFTSMTAIGLGLAISTWRVRYGARAWLAVPVGLVAAMTLHGLWNLSASLHPALHLLLYIVIMMPLFVGVVVAVIVLRKREGATVAAILGSYRDAGWLSPADVHMMSTLPHRRHARAWATGQVGPGGAKVMAAYQQSLTTLAGLRITGPPAFTKENFAQREDRLLTEARAHQHRLRLV